MSQTTITAGQSLIDVAVQELGSVEALFDLADAAGLAITDTLTPGSQLPVPSSAATRPQLASYFQRLPLRVNSGDLPLPPPPRRRHDFNQTDFLPSDFN